jgi:hypothetical protein
MARFQESMYERNLARDVAALERERDKLYMALDAMVKITSGNFKERVNAINVLYEIKGKQNGNEY